MSAGRYVALVTSPRRLFAVVGFNHVGLASREGVGEAVAT
jgi:hypothetical protein